MRTVSARFLGLGCGVWVALSAASAQAVVFSLKAVAVNGVPLVGGPVNNLTITPGQQVTAEVFISRWADDGFVLGGYELKFLNRIAAITGTNGNILPLGWTGPAAVRIECNTNLDCSSQSEKYPLCDLISGLGCIGAGLDPSLGAILNQNHTNPDFVFLNLATAAVIDDSNLDYRYTAIREGPPGVTDPGSSRYAGTLILRALPSACGTFTFGFDPESSFITNSDSPPLQAFPVIQPLVLTASPCARYMIDCDPDHGWVDSRQNITRTSLAPLNINQIVAHFTGPTAGMTTADFEFKELKGIPPFPNRLDSVAPVVGDPNALTLNFQRRIPTELWTCVRDRLGDRRCCVGSLPADADGNRLSQLLDMVRVVDNLEGLVNPAFQIHKCDMNRSNSCTGADILETADLLTGAELYPPWAGHSIQEVPMNPPE